MRELFIWYRVASEGAAAAHCAVKAMQQALVTDHPGLTARLLIRSDAAARLETWMEIYALAASADGVDARLEGSIEARARPLAAFFASPRHAEAFELCRDRAE